MLRQSCGCILFGSCPPACCIYRRVGSFSFKKRGLIYQDLVGARDTGKPGAGEGIDIPDDSAKKNIVGEQNAARGPEMGMQQGCPIAVKERERGADPVLPESAEVLHDRSRVGT